MFEYWFYIRFLIHTPLGGGCDGQGRLQVKFVEPIRLDLNPKYLFALANCEGVDFEKKEVPFISHFNHILKNNFFKEP